MNGADLSALLGAYRSRFHLLPDTSAGVGDLIRNAAAAARDPHVWIALAIAPIAAAVCVAVGWLVLGKVGLLDDGRDEAAPGTLALSLGAGLVVIAVLWASAFSRGTSYFVPVGIAVVAALFVAGRRAKAKRDTPSFPLKSAIRPGAATLLLVFALAIFNSMSAPSPANGVQPASVDDHSYWVALTRGLDRTGSESTWCASGFDSVPNAPFERSWYHWGELWLGSALDHIPGVEPMFARYLIVIPLITAAGALLSGTLVRRLAGKPRAFWFGAAGFLFVGPLILLPSCGACPLPAAPIYQMPWLGLSPVAFLLALNVIFRRPSRDRAVAAPLFVAGIIASIPLLNIGTAMLFGAGVVAAAIWRWRDAMRELRRPGSAIRSMLVLSAAISAASIVWAFVTGHGLLDVSAARPVPAGQETLAWLSTGFLMFLMIGGGLLALRGGGRDSRTASTFLIGALAVPFAGLTAWLLTSAKLNSEHLLDGTALVGPAVGLGAFALAEKARATGSAIAATAIVAVFAFQAAIGAADALANLPYDKTDGYSYPTGILDAIQTLPPGTRIAYACGGQDNRTFFEPDLVAIDALTGRRMIPMCFGLAGVDYGPQRPLYPTPDSRPTPSQISSFLRSQGIRYVYADENHSNTLVSDAVTVATDGGARLLRIPGAT